MGRELDVRAPTAGDTKQIAGDLLEGERIARAMDLDGPDRTPPMARLTT